MNALTLEWVEKAEGDYATAGRELPVQSYPNYDGVCFHAQQVAEKYLKAFLQEHGVAFPKTHNLIELLELCIPVDSSLNSERQSLILLDRYAVQYRYPGDSAAVREAEQAFQSASEVRLVLRRGLRLT